jgi:transcriptional regulator with XRE-family HTH domain
MTDEQAPAMPDSDEFRQALAEELRALFARHRLNQREVADRFGWHRSALTRRLNGEVSWDVRDLLALCYLLGTDIGTLTEAARRTATDSADRATAL